MQAPGPRPTILRFGVFEVDLQAEELRKSGLRIKIPGQSFHILRLLLDRPGELVTREELRQALWPGNTYVDFDHGLNAAVTRMREALGDAADSPRFVETLPRRGYRFIGTLLPSNGHGHHPVLVEQELRQAVVEPTPARQSRTGLLGSLLAAGLILSIGVAVFLLRRDKPAPNFSLIPLTSLPGQELHPSFSPDGSRIVFAWDGNPPAGKTGFDLYVKVLGSEHLLRLTNRAYRWVAPEWSPDGRQIVFTASEGKNSGIYSISALGGDERQLRSGAGYHKGTALSADGHYLAYPRALPRSDLYRIELLDMQTLLPLPVSLPNCLNSDTPSFAPRGQEMAFACAPSWGILDLYVIPQIGAQPRYITRILGLSTGITWTPDHRLIVSVINGRSDLWRVDPASGTSEPLLPGSHASAPTVALAGERLAFAQTVQSSNIWRLNLQDRSQPPERFIASTRVEQNPAYSPDGTHILFESERSGFSEVWVANSDGTDPQQLTHFAGPLTGSPRWAPDSRRFAFDSRAEGQSNIYLMDINERVLRRIETDVPDNSRPTWSRDGNWIYFRSDAAAKPGIYKVAPAGGRSQLVFACDGFGATESLDGTELYYSSGYKQTVLRKLALADGKDTALLPENTNTRIDSWALTPEGIYYLEPNDRGATVNFFEFRNRRERKIIDLPLITPMMGGLAVSPDGKYLLYSQIGEQQSDLMLVENFR